MLWVDVPWAGKSILSLPPAAFQQSIWKNPLPPPQYSSDSCFYVTLVQSIIQQWCNQSFRSKHKEQTFYECWALTAPPPAAVLIEMMTPTSSEFLVSVTMSMELNLDPGPCGGNEVPREGPYTAYAPLGSVFLLSLPHSLLYWVFYGERKGQSLDTKYQPCSYLTFTYKFSPFEFADWPFLIKHLLHHPAPSQHSHDY